MKKLLRALAWLSCAGLLVFAPSAVAVDGVVLINQGTSVNGLPGCAHSGFPITICKSGSYRLSGDLTVSNVNTNGIDIAAANVTLDLNGFSISGPVTCRPNTFPVVCSASGSGSGITTTQDNITVRNGTVRGMGASGVTLAGSGYIVDGVHTEFNADPLGAGIDAGAALGVVVTHCTATTNAGSGISAGSGTISFNTVQFNGGDGIVITAGGATVTNNNASNNGQSGIHDAFLAAFNVALNNVGFGILNDQAAQAGYMSNVVAGNGGTVSGGQSLGHNLCNGAAC